jgi:hypothetical protein
MMATMGRLVELLRAEARVAQEDSDQASHERLLELADDIGEMSAEQVQWVAQASDDELRGFVSELRLRGGGA